MRITKLISAVIGVPIVIASFALTVGGGIALAVPDDDGWVSFGPNGLETDSVALVTDNLEVDFGHSIADGRTFISWGEIPAEVEIESRNGKSIFVGIASSNDVAAYLDGVAYDRISSFDDDDRVVHERGAYEAAPPTAEDFWVASSVDETLRWDVRPGQWTIVALNADGSPGVDVGVTASAKIPFLTGIGVVFIAVGLIGMTVGVLLIYFGVRRVREPQATPPPPQQPAEPMPA